MSTPTSIEVSTDLEEYSRFESERDTISITVSVQGANLQNEEILLELRKARRGRDEIVATKTLTLTDSLPRVYEIGMFLPEIVDEQNIPKVRRGTYFIRATSVSNGVVTIDSEDFYVSLVSVARLKADYLHGADQYATNVLAVREQPINITGVTVESISLGHPQNWFPLSYNFAVHHAPVVVGAVSEPFSLSDGMTLVLRTNSGNALIATFDTGDFVDIAAATAEEVVDSINAQLSDSVTASVSTEKISITGGTTSILVDPAGTATTVLGLLNKSDVPSVTRTLTWCNGPTVVLESGRKTYILRRGTSADNIQVRVGSFALLPTESVAEDILIYRKPLDESRIRDIINQAISWIEDVALSVYLEPTRLVTEVDPDSVGYLEGSDIPNLVGATWDKVVDALQHTAPAAGHWLNFKFPYIPILRFDELYGKLANVRIVDIALEWVEAHKSTGFVELVPFNQEVAFNFIGLMWVESIRGPIPLPNFWNFNVLVGYEKTPPVLIELVAKKAAIDVLVIAEQAFRPGITSTSLSRDGISESVSYARSGMYGIFGASISTYQKWIDDNIIAFRGATRGPNMIIV